MEEQIIGILREQEAGAKIVDVCRRYGVGSAIFYKWKAKYGGLIGRLRDELLNEMLFNSLSHAREALAIWKADCNTVRPHQSASGRLCEN